jgi:hypothetical protein
VSASCPVEQDVEQKMKPATMPHIPLKDTCTPMLEEVRALPLRAAHPGRIRSTLPSPSPLRAGR